MAFDYSTIDLEGMLQRSYEEMNELQRPGVAKARTSGRIIFDVWMGVGKTFMGLTAGLCFKPQAWLIIGSKNSLSAWRGEVEKWYPEFAQLPGGVDGLFKIVRGTQAERQAIYQTRALWYATTPGAFIRDADWLLTKKVKFEVITVDELQKAGFRNRKSVNFKQLKALIKHVNRFTDVKLLNFTTGTWTSKGIPQSWPVLHLLAPKEFASYWKYVHTFCNVVKGQFGTTILGPKNTEAWAIATSPYVYKVTEEEAGQKLPPLRRSKLYTELPSNMTAKYWSLAEELYMELESGELLTVATILAAYTKMRQFVNCPAVIDPHLGVGPAIEIIADKIKDFDELPNWKHNIVFSPFLDAIPHFAGYLGQELGIPQSKIIIMKGGLEPEELRANEERFRRDPETMILASLKYSQSWNAETAVNVYFPGFDWDQDENSQAESRARRTSGVQQLINSYYVDIKGTITEDMFTIIGLKTHMNRISYQDVTKLKERLKAKLRRP